MPDTKGKASKEKTSSQEQLNCKTSTNYSKQLFINIYLWMFAGVALTTIAGIIFVLTGLSNLLNSTRYLKYALFIIQIVSAIILKKICTKSNSKYCVSSFLFYSFITGLTFTSLFYNHSLISIVSTFLISAIIFGSMFVYGYVTKEDLSNAINLSLMGLLGIIMGSIFNIFFANAITDWILTYTGIIGFLTLIANDTKKIKENSSEKWGKNKAAILGALTLYADFINLNLLLSLVHLVIPKREG